MPATGWGSSVHDRPGSGISEEQIEEGKAGTFDMAALTVGDLIRSFLKRFSISSVLVEPELRQAMVCAGRRWREKERRRMRRECRLAV